MDRKLNERLIGASILVLVAVMIIPELLSGPKSASESLPRPPVAATLESTEPTHTVTLDVETSSAPGVPETTNEAAPLPTPAPKLEAAAKIDAAPKNDAAPKAGTVAEVPAASAVAQPARSASAQRSGSWAVQLGSFTSAQNANKLLHELTRHGYSAYILESRIRGRIQHKVRVGPAADRAAAERILVKLRADGHSGALIAPSR